MKKIFSICLLLLLSICIYSPYTVKAEEAENTIEESAIVITEDIEEDLGENVLDMKEVTSSNNLTQIEVSTIIKEARHLYVFIAIWVGMVLLGTFFLFCQFGCNEFVIPFVMCWMGASFSIFLFLNSSYTVIPSSCCSEEYVVISSDTFKYEGSGSVTATRCDVNYIIKYGETSNKIEFDSYSGEWIVTVPEYLIIEN